MTGSSWDMWQCAKCAVFDPGRDMAIQFQWSWHRRTGFELGTITTDTSQAPCQLCLSLNRHGS